MSDPLEPDWANWKTTAEPLPWSELAKIKKRHENVKMPDWVHRDMSRLLESHEHFQIKAARQGEEIKRLREALTKIAKETNYLQHSPIGQVYVVGELAKEALREAAND